MFLFDFCLRAVIWLQKQRDEILERVRGGTLRKEEQYEYHIGRLRQDRVHVSRADDVSVCGPLLHLMHACLQYR